MKNRFLTIKHRVWGEIGLEIEGTHIHFLCNWPFDLNTGEWIQISNTFALKDYISKVQRLSKQKKVTIQGIQSGYLCLKRIARGEIEFNLSVQRNSVSQETFAYKMQVSRKALLPANGEGRVFFEV